MNYNTTNETNLKRKRKHDIYPTGICRSCNSLYSKHEKGDEVNFPKFPNYNDMILPRETRQNTSPECNCYICITARDKTRKPRCGGILQELWLQWTR